MKLIKIRATATVIEALQFLEQAAWEDCGMPKNVKWAIKHDPHNYAAITHLVLHRYKTVIELRRPEELYAVQKSAKFWADDNCAVSAQMRAAFRRLDEKLQRLARSRADAPRCKGENYHVFALGANNCSLCSWDRYKEQAS